MKLLLLLIALMWVPAEAGKAKAVKILVTKGIELIKKGGKAVVEGIKKLIPKKPSVVIVDIDNSKKKEATKKKEVSKKKETKKIVKKEKTIVKK